MRDALLRLQYRRHGIEAVNKALFTPGHPARLLRRYGARVAPDAIVHGPVTIHNAERDYRNLCVGKRAHIGRGVFLDLAAELLIEAEATVSMGCTILTHQDIGDRPLADLYPRFTAPTTIRTGAYLGANVTILAGVTIGSFSVVAAGAVVTEDVPDDVLAAGVPARQVKALDGSAAYAAMQRTH